ncbi:BZ3500_MvSof-1268-A1-R1_Chr2-2g05173 [Microbotryum saponariae]|uniref:BZ3500_MvSof-1268-A1-R1_Chr2-2g05173 protein n=1 Tax=Microbotryum saponariae TaxID=289078 RepID=A0A2X0L7N8_9BASI|nr:BZ3500_MvSof-1268-A1-R1_Chr2-2g05173 [Microbotryum saponariae]SDA01000.1 BZ3501_MvSof-1269-A2-R1_Chr2-2g04847 [Microbotryum saponariae]
MLVRGIISSVLLASMCSALPILYTPKWALGAHRLKALKPRVLLSVLNRGLSAFKRCAPSAHFADVRHRKNILTPGNSLINTNVLANVLGYTVQKTDDFNRCILKSEGNCTGKGVLGVQTNLQLLNLLKVCSCVKVLNPLSNQVTYPPCPANASPSPICAQASGQCGCERDLGYYLTKVNGTQLIATVLGMSGCVCSRGYVDDLAGGCISACLVIG